MAAQERITGTVIDDDTGAAMPDVHVFEADRPSGTVTDSDGRFMLSVPSLPTRLVTQHIGYGTREIRVEMPSDVTVRLTPAVFELDELVVSSEDFATRLMRRVIARKRRMYEALGSFTAVGFTRQVLERGDRIAHLSDAAFDFTWYRVRDDEAEITAVSSTADWHRELPLPEHADVPNLYDDVVSMQGVDMIGPTHPDALDFYVFRVAARRTLGEHDVYDVNVTPLGEQEAAFVGQISIVDGSFVMIEARLAPARHFTYPDPVAAWNVRYQQHFRELADSVWVPANLSLEGTLRIYVDARTSRSVDLTRRTLLSEHRINAPSDTEVGGIPWNDPQFRYGRVLMPMTAQEQAALQQLSSASLTLREAFPPERREGPLTAFLDPDDPTRVRWPSIGGYRFRFRYNRVDGFLSSVGQNISLTPETELSWRLGQASGLRKVRSSATVGHNLGAGIAIRADISRDVVVAASSSGHPDALTSLQAALGSADYYDYLWRRHVGAEVLADVGPFLLTAGVAQDEDDSVDRKLSRSWPLARTFRPNPAIRHGRFRSAYGGIEFARNADGLRHAAGIRITHSSNELFESDATYSQIEGHIAMALPTLAARRPAPARFELRLQGGASTGDLPPQRRMAADAAFRLFGALNLNRSVSFKSVYDRPLYGSHALAVYWRLDFTTLPFELVQAWPLARRGMGMALFGAPGRTWMSSTDASGTGGRSVHEIGLSVTNVWGTPLQLDVATGLDEPQMLFGISARL